MTEMSENEIVVPALNVASSTEGWTGEVEAV
jgi:hypothetical protein